MSSSSSHSRGSHHHSKGGSGSLVKVGFARTQAEAEMMQALLLDAGIESMVRRGRGFDNPDFLAGGPHEVVVDSDLVAKARGVLEGTMLESEDEARADEMALERPSAKATPPQRLAAYVLGAFLVAVLIVWVLYEIS